MAILLSKEEMINTNNTIVITSTEADKYNDLMFDSSHEQVFAFEEKQLVKYQSRITVTK